MFSYVLSYLVCNVCTAYIFYLLHMLDYNNARTVVSTCSGVSIKNADAKQHSRYYSHKPNAVNGSYVIARKTNQCAVICRILWRNDKIQLIDVTREKVTTYNPSGSHFCHRSTCIQDQLSSFIAASTRNKVVFY